VPERVSNRRRNNWEAYIAIVRNRFWPYAAKSMLHIAKETSARLIQLNGFVLKLGCQFWFEATQLEKS